MEDAVDVADMLPNEATDLRVSGNRFIPTTLEFIASRWSLDASVVHRRHCGVGNLFLKNKDNVAMEYRHCVGLALWYGG